MNASGQKKPLKERLIQIVYKAGFWFVKITAAPAMLLFRPKVHYPEGKKYRIKGGALLISNHHTNVDPLYMMFIIWHRNHHFICTKEFYQKPLLAFIFNCFQCIPVDKENTGTATIREIAAHLRAGELVSMFPEGHINTSTAQNADIEQFKSGMVLMSLMAGTPIIPMYLKKRKTVFSRLEAAVGEPVDVASFYGKRPSLQEIEEITRILQERFEKLRRVVEGE